MAAAGDILKVEKDVVWLDDDDDHHHPEVVVGDQID